MKRTANNISEDMPELDLRRVRVTGVGEHFRKMAAANRYVQLAPDVSRAFPDSAAVNDALRQLLKMRQTLVSLPVGKTRRRKSA
jgi:hypothetical protein